MIRFLGNIAICFLLAQMITGCGLFDDPTTTSVSCDSDCNVTVTNKPQPTTSPVAVSGKLAQSYVKDARIWADKLVDGEGDLQWENGEPLALSGGDGSYQLTEIAGDFQLVTYGGKKQDSAGNWIDAPLMNK